MQLTEPIHEPTRIYTKSRNGWFTHRMSVTSCDFVDRFLFGRSQPESGTHESCPYLTFPVSLRYNQTAKS
jgi:hypothetical protein